MTQRHRNLERERCRPKIAVIDCRLDDRAGEGDRDEAGRIRKGISGESHVLDSAYMKELLQVIDSEISLATG